MLVSALAISQSVLMHVWILHSQRFALKNPRKRVYRDLGNSSFTFSPLCSFARCRISRRTAPFYFFPLLQYGISMDSISRLGYQRTVVVSCGSHDPAHLRSLLVRSYTTQQPDPSSFRTHHVHYTRRTSIELSPFDPLSICFLAVHCLRYPGYTGQLRVRERV
jgi:hypothetical protein